MKLMKKKRKSSVWLQMDTSNKEIAAEMYLGEGTVRNYLSSILDKLQLRDRTQVAVFYYKHR